MAIPVSYNFRNLVVRKTTTLMTALGIALTVAVLLAMMALLTGLRSTLSASGDPLQIIVMRKGSETGAGFQLHPRTVSGSEIQGGHRARAERRSHGVARSGDRDQPAQRRCAEGENVTVRGLLPIGLEMRKGLKITSGRWFDAGKRELVVGKSIAQRYPGAALGKRITFGRGDWEVVGVMDAGQSAQNSEIFGDLNQISDRSGSHRSAQLGPGARRRRGDGGGAGEEHQRRSAPEYERGFRKRILRTANGGRRRRSNFWEFSYPSLWRSEAVSRR